MVFDPAPKLPHGPRTLIAVLLFVTWTTMVLAATSGPLVARLAAMAGAGCSAAMAYALQRCLSRLQHELDAARHDPLTGLATRAVAEHLLERATRDGVAVTVALADVDGLHAVNRNFGHAAGDQYLVVIARRLQRAVPPGGQLVRQGGDEFILLAAGVEPATLAAALRAAMAGPTVIAGQRLQPRASIGVAAGADNAGYARACADAAMATAKQAGGNRLMIYDADRDGIPAPDGTRALVRRRDLVTPGPDGLAWQPAPGDDLMPLLVSTADVTALRDAARAARDQWAGRVLTGTSAASLSAGQRYAMHQAERRRRRFASLATRLTQLIADRRDAGG